MEAIEARARAEPRSYEAQLELGKALFEAEKFADARRVFAAAAELPSADGKKCNLWIRKCDTHLDDAEAASASSSAAATAAAAAPATNASTSPTPAPVTCGGSAPAPTQVARSHNVRFEWFQTASAVTLTFFVKNRTRDDVVATASERSLDLTIKLGEGHEYTHDIENLFGPIDATNMKVEVKSMKVEITLPKAQPGFQWSVLEAPVVQDAAGGAPKAVTAAAVANPALAVLPKSASELPVPNSKGRDWAKFKLEEEEEKLEGDHALNKFFRDIYKNASDEQRMSMMKSFQESGGTVLSTNPAEVLNKKVECQPPKGMEVRKWEQ